MTDTTQGASPTFRYFYTDPLAAAWMAKHHNMRFISDVGVEVAWEYDQVSFHWDSLSGLFHIHPDSLHLLEPKSWDLCAFDGEFPGSTIWLIYDHKEATEVFRSIIQRNGITFHWPEREAA